MKRLPISQDQRLFLKAIENNAMLFILMFKVFPTPINADSLAFDMKWDARKARRQLDDLSSDGFTALMKGQGYVLTSATRKMFVDFFGSLLPLEAQQALALVSQAQAQQVLEGEVSTTVPALVAQNSSAHSARALVVEEDILTININLESSTPTSSDAQNVRADGFPTVRQILSASPILFAAFDGKEVSLRGLSLEAIDPEEALAVMAHCYAQRRTEQNQRGLYAPAGMVHNMLRDGDKARREFRNAPLDYLPDEYLEALGLMDYACDVCCTSFKTRAALIEHESALIVCKYGCGKRSHSNDEMTAHHKTHADEDALTAPLVCKPLDPQHKGVRAWELVKAQLQADLPRASYETWVQNAQAVEYDEQILTIGVRNAYGRDWLISRLEDKVNHILHVTLRQTANVRFVVAEIEDADNDQ